MKTILKWLLSVSLLATTAGAKEIELLNVSYDPTRELYQEINCAFAKEWKQKFGDDVNIKQSHAGSGKQARSVIDGLPADVVTLALAFDIDAIAKHGIIAKDWQKRLPNNSTPYTSTVVFIVRKGNPKRIKDWDDLVRPGVKILPANPKTSGGARWTYLAAYGAALKRSNGDEASAKKYIVDFYKHAPVLDNGARGATTTFIQREIGDVLVSWESEALVALNQLGKGKFEIVYPSISIVAEPPVTVVEKVVEKKKTRAVAAAYLDFLFTPPAQEIAAKHFFRPTSAELAKKFENTFKTIPTFTIDEVFGGWANAHKTHFAEGGVFDQIFKDLR